MEKGRKKIRICLCVIVLLAVIVGILYYYGQLQEQANITEGTLISGHMGHYFSRGMDLRQLWQ